MCFVVMRISPRFLGAFVVAKNFAKKFLTKRKAARHLSAEAVKVQALLRCQHWRVYMDGSFMLNVGT